MKRQRNTQQVKEQEKCPPNQTKEEKIGNQPEKEFRIMIIKMIQNLENKIELQINNLETNIEKMQEMLNKDLEEIKKNQLEWESRWQRNRTGRSLSLLQIHRKNNRTVNKVYKTTSDR